MRYPWRSPAVIAASVALVLCGGSVAVAGVRALRIGTFDQPSGSPAAARPAGVTDREHRPVAAAFARAAARDPFHPERRASTDRFAMPGSGSDAPADQPQAPDPETAGEVRLIGTAVVPGGRDFVMCRTDHERPLIVRVGERCGTLVLRAVKPQEARFTGEDGSVVVLHVPKTRTSP